MMAGLPQENYCFFFLQLYILIESVDHQKVLHGHWSIVVPENNMVIDYIGPHREWVITENCH